RSARDCRNHNAFGVFEQIVSPGKPVCSTQPAHATRSNLRFAIKLTCLFIERNHDRDRTLISQLLPLTHSLAVDLSKSALVDERASDLTFVDHGRTLAVKLEHVTILDQDDVLFRVAEMVFDKLLVSKQHAILAVNRNHKLRAHRLGHDANIFLRRVPADVDQPSLLFDDVRAALVNESDHARDQTLVSGNDARRKHDRVAFVDHQSLVTLHRHLRECRARLALRSGHQKHDFIVAHHLRFVERNEQAVGYVEISESLGNLDVLLHRTSEHADVTIKLLGNVENDLQTMNR